MPVAAEHVAQLRRIGRTPPSGGAGAKVDATSGWPLDEPSVTHFAVLVDDEVRGLVQYGEQDDEDYRHASIDIFLKPAVHGRGWVGTRWRHSPDTWLTTRGHHRLVMSDPAADNTAAIRCYASVGFRPVGIMRRYERDAQGGGWHDGLLMDLLAEELPRASVHGEGRARLLPSSPRPTDVTATA